MTTAYKYDKKTMEYSGAIEVTSIRPQNSTLSPLPTEPLQPGNKWYWRGMWMQESEISNSPIPVSVTDISGVAVLSKEDDNSSAIITPEADLSITISVPLPDDSPVLVPLKRTDTSRVVKAFGTVTSGEVNLNVQLPTAGDWYCDSSLINEQTLTGLTFSFSGLKLIAVI